MALPEIGDGTVALRPFRGDDRERAITWLTGPGATTRSATDGGPQMEAAAAADLVDTLAHTAAAIVEVDGEAVGWAGLRGDRAGTGHLQVVLSEPALWAQGVGARTLRLLLRLGFDHLELTCLRADRCPETAEAVRTALEDAGFHIERRFLHQEAVHLDLTLPRQRFLAQEQRVLLLIHGTTEREAQGRLLGAAVDPPLDALGRAQAEALGQCPLLHGLGEALVSPLARARTTAEQALAARGVPCTIDEAWGDRDWGEWSGQALDELPRDDDGHLADPPSGEDGPAFERRVRRALDVVPHGNDLAVVTHAAVVARLLLALNPDLGQAPGLRTGAGLGAATVSELRRGPDGWAVIRIADDRHLRARRATSELAEPR